MPTISDYLFHQGWQANVYVRLVSNTTSVAYISTDKSDANGLYTITAPADIYTVYTGPTSGGPWTATGNQNYLVPDSSVAINQISLKNNFNIYNVKTDYGAVGDGVNNDTIAIQNAINAAQTAGGGIVYFPKGTYLQNAKFDITAQGITLLGAGKGLVTIFRVNTTNQVQVQGTGAVNLTIKDIGFDANGANQTFNWHTVSLDTASHNTTVENCRFINVAGFVVWVFGGPTSRVNNLRILNNDVTQLSGQVLDILVPVSNGGITSGNRVSVQGGVGINVYESNDHPCINNTILLNGAVGTGIVESSCISCPIEGNSLTLGTNDTGISVLRETDNVGAREMVGASLVGNSISGVSSSIAYKVGIVGNASGRCSSVHISGGTVKNTGYIIQYGSSVVGITLADIDVINVVNPWTGTVPPFTWWHHINGVSPFGKLAAVTVPATTIDIVNNNQVDAVYYFAGGTVTALSVGFQPPIILFLTTTSTGGTLAGSITYAYRVTLVDNAGGETLPSPEVTIAVPAGTSTNTVTITWYQPTSALRAGSGTSYKVYGRTTGAELFIATVSSNPLNSYTDTGSITPAGALPTVNGSQRATGMIAGPIYVPSNQTVAATYTVAPTATAWGVN